MTKKQICLNFVLRQRCQLQAHVSQRYDYYANKTMIANPRNV